MSKEIIKVGDKYTISGFGIGKHGQIVIDNYNPMTKRKCMAVREARFVITQESKLVKVLPSII